MSNKYFVKIEKAYEDKGDWFVQGVATGTLEDREGQRMSKSVIETFAKAIPLPLTNNHAGGDISGDLGEVVYAEVLNTPTNDLFIKGKLDKDHPYVPYFVKQVQKGKQFAFSIEGIHAVKKTVWSENLKKFVDEFTDVTPTAISITTMPSYSPSFLEVVSKSVKTQPLDGDELKDSNLNIKNKEMEDKTTETVETVTEPEVISEAEVQTTETQPEQEVEVVETETAPEQTEEVATLTKSDEILSALTAISDRMTVMEKSFAEKLEGITKSMSEVDEIKKSMVTTQELVKSIPQLKKSIVARQIDAVQKSNEPQTFAQALVNAPIIG